MAEALLRHHAGGRLEALSSGLEPAEVHPLALTVLEERGVDTGGLRSKCTTEFLGKELISYAVVVCEQAAKKCPQLYPFTVSNLYWPFEDPAAFQGSDAERLAKFRSVCDQIDARIRAWLEELPELKRDSHEQH
jgi:arsenate reductase